MASTINAKNTSSGLVLTPDASGQLELQTADTTRMTIDVNGNVGVGTSSPTSALHVYRNASGTLGAVRVESGPSAQFAPRLYLTDSRTGQSGRDWGITSGGNAAGALCFDDNTAGLNRMVIDSSGNVGIGTSSPATRLQVNYTGASASGVYIVSGTAGDDASQPILISKTSATVTAGTNKYIQFVTNNGAASTGFIASNGTNNAGFFAGSDRRIKKDIQPITDGIFKISQLKPSLFVFKDTEESSEGFIAQEINEVFPQCVYKPNDGNGDDLPEGQEPWAVNTDKLIPYLVASIQELKAELDEVKAELAELKGAA